MSRWVRHFAPALLVLLPGLGCYNPQLNLPLWTTAKLAASGAKKPQELPPDEAAAVCMNLGRTLEKTGHDAEAAGQYEKAREYNPRAEVAHRLAVVYDRMGNYPRAVAEYQKALEAHPKDADVLNDLGYHYYCRGQWLEAEKHLQQAVEVNAKHRAAWINLGMTLGQQERYSESLGAFAKAVSPAEAQCNLAFILTTQGKRDQARQAYREALALEPDLHLARAALAKLEKAGQGSPARPGSALREAPAVPPILPAAVVPPVPDQAAEVGTVSPAAATGPAPASTESAAPKNPATTPIVLPPPPTIAKPASASAP
jgi:tetratricopeptide (TPR) repeat protein